MKYFLLNVIFFSIYKLFNYQNKIKSNVKLNINCWLMLFIIVINYYNIGEVLFQFIDASFHLSILIK
jgi:hypothetical protein